MRCALGLVFALVAGSTLAADAPAPAPAPPAEPGQPAAQVVVPAPAPPAPAVPAPLAAPAAPQAAPAPAAPDAPARPDVAPPAPVPVPAERATPVPRLRISSQPWTTLISEPPVFADEAAVSSEMREWRDYLQGKKERRIERGAEVGGLSAMGIRLGSKSQADSIEGLTTEQAAALEKWNDEGALVLSVVEGSPAEAAGIVPGDVVVQFAGVWVDSTSLLVRMASRCLVGREQEVWLLRDGGIERTYVTLVDRKDLGR